MKLLFIAIFMLVVYANADEIQRIESIVEDIAKLRVDYEKSQEALSLSLVKIEEEKEKNLALSLEVKKLKKEVENLENQTIKQKKSNLSNKNKKVIIKEKIEKCVENQIVKKNEFPQLQMKEKTTKSVIVEKEAHTYRLKNNTNIYDAKDGEVIEEWEARSSFTSNLKSGEWIKITGYFIDRVWHKAIKELWVREEDAYQREQN